MIDIHWTSVNIVFFTAVLFCAVIGIVAIFRFVVCYQILIEASHKYPSQFFYKHVPMIDVMMEDWSIWLPGHWRDDIEKKYIIWVLEQHAHSQK